MNETLIQSIEAMLFATSEPQSFRSLAERLQVSAEDIQTALETLATRFEDHGIMLVVHDNTATLVTKPAFSALIESIRKDDLQKELSKASSETLAIISYRPGVTKAEIEFIRGVNASYSLRALQMRGLIEAKKGESGRSVSYQPTVEMLEYFGVSSVEGLPNYTETKQKIDTLLERSSEVAPAE
jgi:segregation and condensation protein B